MELYLIRHGIAQEREIAIKDETRSLTAQGREKTRKVAQKLRELRIEFDEILTSPFVRSQQTAEILSDCQLSQKITVSLHLAPAGSIYDWLDWLHQQPYSSTTRLALVGHQPDLGDWGEILVWGAVRSQIILKKAGIIGLVTPETGSPIGQSQLFWLTAPKFLL